MRFFKVVFASALGYILAIVLFIITIIFIAIGVASNSKPEVKIPSNGVLNMKLNYPLADKSVDYSPIVFLSAFKRSEIYLFLFDNIIVLEK